MIRLEIYFLILIFYMVERYIYLSLLRATQTRNVTRTVEDCANIMNEYLCLENY